MQRIHQLNMIFCGLNLGEKSEASFDIGLGRFSPLWGVRYWVHGAFTPSHPRILTLIFIRLQLTAEAVWVRKPSRGAEPTAG